LVSNGFMQREELDSGDFFYFSIVWKSRLGLRKKNWFDFMFLNWFKGVLSWKINFFFRILRCFDVVFFCKIWLKIDFKTKKKSSPNIPTTTMVVKI